MLVSCFFANFPFAVRDCFMVCVKKGIEVVQCALCWGQGFDEGQCFRFRGTPPCRFCLQTVPICYSYSHPAFNPIMRQSGNQDSSLRTTFFDYRHGVVSTHRAIDHASTYSATPTENTLLICLRFPSAQQKRKNGWASNQIWYFRWKHENRSVV